MLIVTNGLVEAPQASTPDHLQLHPLLSSLQKEIAGRASAWFRASPHTPLSLLAWMLGATPASLIALHLDLPEEIRQCWVASPFHARLMRDHLQVMPEGMLSWSPDAAAELVEVLNPLFEGEGMALHAAGAALVLACREPMDAAPVSFADVSGKLLPNRHPEGADGGRLMRLVAEIQMFLHDHRSSLKKASDISGLWFWGGADVSSIKPAELPAVATHNPFLASVTEGKDASLTITDAEQLDELINHPAPLARNLILFGDNHALWLTPSPAAKLTSKLRRKASRILSPSGVRDEASLLQQMKGRV